MGRATDFTNCYIYHIKSKDGVVHYVGSTSNLNSRKSKHKYNCSHENNPHYHFDIYQYIRNNGGFDAFSIVPIRKIENVTNKTDLLIAEQTEMEKHSGLKNMKGSYLSEEERAEKMREHAKIWAKNNPEYKRNYKENNPEKIKEKDRKYYQAHKEKINEYQRQYRLKKKELKAAEQ